MPEIRAGQTRSVSLPRKADRTKSAVAESRQMAETQMTDHLIRFVAETSVVQSPWAMEDEKVLAEAQGDDPEIAKEENCSESSEDDIAAGYLKLKAVHRSRSARL